MDFINLDNATRESVRRGPAGLVRKNSARRCGESRRFARSLSAMHEALPESISKDHSMDESEGGTETGLRVYADLLKARQKNHKRVYVLASHSHYFMDGTFNTEYWRKHGGSPAGMDHRDRRRRALQIATRCGRRKCRRDQRLRISARQGGAARAESDSYSSALDESDVPAADQRALHSGIRSLVLRRKFRSDTDARSAPQIKGTHMATPTGAARPNPQLIVPDAERVSEHRRAASGDRSRHIHGHRRRRRHGCGAGEALPAPPNAAFAFCAITWSSSAFSPSRISDMR